MRLIVLSAATLALLTASFEAEACARIRSVPHVNRHTTVQGVVIAAPARPAPAAERVPAVEDRQEPAPMLAAAIFADAPRTEPGREDQASASTALKIAPQPLWCATGRVAGTGKGFCLVN
jgi:hypothetical protein